MSKLLAAKAKATVKKPVAKTVKTATKVVKKTAVKAVKTPVAKAVKKVVKTVKEKPVVHITPVKEVLNRTALLERMSNSLFESGMVADITERKAKEITKHFLADLEAIILGCVHPKGCGELTLPGLMKIMTKKIPAKKMPARPKGEKLNPLTGKMVMMEARAAFTKPATVRVKVRPMKKMKDAAVM